MEEDSFQQITLHEMQCPFIWDECTSKFDEINWVKHFLNKLSRPNCNDWRQYSFKLLLGCVYGHLNINDTAFETFESCEKHLNEKCNEEFFIDIKEGMQHVITASKCHLYKKIGMGVVTNDIAERIIPFKCLSKESQAAVWAIKAYILCEFGYDGMMKALECIKIAVELDPDDDGTRRGAWYYLMGKIHSELRRVRSFNEMPSKEELKMLEKSIKKNPFPVHRVVLADSYREASKVLLKLSYTKNKGMSEKVCQASLNYYKEAMTGEDLTVSILKRCGMGLMKLPKKFRDVELAEEALQMAYKLAPEDSSVLLGLGYFQEWHKNDAKAALPYYEKSYERGNQNAGIQMIGVLYKINRDYNPEDDCNKYIDNLRHSLRSRISLEWMAAFMAIKGEFNLYIKHDLLAAAREWEKAMDLFPDASNLLEYRCIFESKRGDFNIYDLLTSEIGKEIERKKFNVEDEEYLCNLLRRCQEKISQVHS